MANVFVGNIDHAFSDDAVTGAYARKTLGVSSRFVWYQHDCVVLPARPDPDFLRYAASLGASPEILVPAGINPERLSIMDGIRDPRFARVFHGNSVQSYIRSPEIYKAVTQSGGRYVGGDPGGSTDRANDKGLYSYFAEDIVRMPPNQRLVRGTYAIAGEVMRRIHQGRPTFVRLTRSGGGLGNRQFFPQEHGRMTLRQISRILEGDQPDIWRNGEALVEDRIQGLLWPVGVNFHTETGHAYDSLNVNQGDDFIGFWSPTPEKICPPGRLSTIGTHFAGRLRRDGFYGWGGTDLGIRAYGEEYGFEINGRLGGVHHGIVIGQRFFGPWHTWRSKGVVTKSIDHFVLARRLSFARLYQILDKMGVLATRQKPDGAVITIPPMGNVAGIQVFGRTYRAAHNLYVRILDAVGDAQANREDHPLFH